MRKRDGEMWRFIIIQMRSELNNNIVKWKRKEGIYIYLELAITQFKQICCNKYLPKKTVRNKSRRRLSGK
jgi:hypothetical protein